MNCSELMNLMRTAQPLHTDPDTMREIWRHYHACDECAATLTEMAAERERTSTLAEKFRRELVREEMLEKFPFLSNGH